MKLGLLRRALHSNAGLKRLAAPRTFRFYSSASAIENYALENRKEILEVIKHLQSGEVDHDALHLPKGFRKEVLSSVWGRYNDVQKLLDETLKLSTEAEDDPVMQSLIETDLEEVSTRISGIITQSLHLLVPTEPLNRANALLEFRYAEGGDDSCLFIAELLKIYTTFSLAKGWDVNILSSTKTDICGMGNSVFGYTECVVEISSQNQEDEVFGTFKWETGLHRQQRISPADKMQRKQTMSCTVYVTPSGPVVEEDVDASKIFSMSDVRIDFYRSSGAGGQSVNKTDSAVRMTHLPTGLIVTCQDDRSQHVNKRRAQEILMSRVLDQHNRALDEAERLARKEAVSGTRWADRIRTYNYPQDRCTDHRINHSLNLQTVIHGLGLDTFHDMLAEEEINMKLQRFKF